MSKFAVRYNWSSRDGRNVSGAFSILFGANGPFIPFFQILLLKQNFQVKFIF